MTKQNQTNVIGKANLANTVVRCLGTSAINQLFLFLPFQPFLELGGSFSGLLSVAEGQLEGAGVVLSLFQSLFCIIQILFVKFTSRMFEFLQLSLIVFTCEIMGLF